MDTPEIDHTTTLRANILRGFFDRSQSKSPVKPTPASPPTPSRQKFPSFLDMIRAKRGFPIATRPPQDTGTAEDAVEGVEDDVSSSRTHESSLADTEVDSSPQFSFPKDLFLSLRPIHIKLPWPSSQAKIPDHRHPHPPAPPSMALSPLLHTINFLTSPPLFWTISTAYLTLFKSPLSSGECLRQ